VGYQTPERERRRRLSTFAIAECVEREGDYLDPVLDYAWAICEQSTWLWPAHLRGAHDHEGLPGVVPDEERRVALFSVGTALLLADLDALLGDRLHPALRERIREEVDRRVLTPFVARDDHGWIGPPAMNWNAVCNAGSAVAALTLLDDPRRQAAVVERAVARLRHYLDDFDADGCTAEGVGYWNYGFGNYVTLAAELEARTDGAYSLLEPPIVREIAEYPLKVQLSPGRFLPFSDTEEDVPVFPHTPCWLGDRLDLEGLGALGRRSLERPAALFEGRNTYFLPELLRDLAWAGRVPDDWTLPTPPRRQFFDGHDWWLVRAAPADPDGLVVAAKGGHNDEPHNHNDCGSFVVHYRGESLLTDLGRPTYDREFFGERRYTDYLTPRSLGHSVPHVNGHEQAAGSEYAADLLGVEEGETDAVAYDLAGCYPDGAGLASLRRRVALHRDEPRVTVADEATFADGPGTLESVLVSYDPVAVEGDALVVAGERARATVTPAADAPVDLRVEHLEDAVDVSWRPDADHWDVWRARLALPPAGTASLELSIAVAGK
jgi:hypothetical protein